MSKITFRADDELVSQLEEFDSSKSEIMRSALRQYIDSHGETERPTDAGLDELVGERLDAMIADRLDAQLADRGDRSFAPARPQDVNVNVTVTEDSLSTREPADDESDTPSRQETESREPRDTVEPGESRGDRPETCSQCGEQLSSSHVHCPNCGEKAARRVFCECGDELRSDWAFCPSCGRRTPAADVLDQ
jgi:predicted RNA-binding Zn-ribbon protein involved in translation (DUF1610 family)